MPIATLIRPIAFLIVVLAQSTTGSERVAITTPDGSLLGGRFFDGGRGSAGVLFFPMCREDAADGWMPVAERLRTAGVSSLITSYRGTQGNTTGRETGDQRGPDADASLAQLRSRIGGDAPVAFAGSSCGVFIALRTAAAHAASTRAVVALSGPHTTAQLEYVRTTPSLAVFSGASIGEPPSPDWARALKQASGHPTSRVEILEPHEHGTDLFRVQPALVDEIANWLAAQLKGSALR